MAKGFNAKQFFVNHGEKLGFGVIVLVVLYALASADWVPYKGDPQKIVDDARAAQQNYDARSITPEEAKELDLVVEADKRPAALVKRNILDDWSAGNWDLPVAMAVSPLDGKQPLKEVQDLFERHPIRDLKASTYWVLLNLGPEQPPAAEESTQPGEEATPPATTLAGGPRGGGAPNLDEEFSRKTNAAGGEGSYPGGAAGMSGYMNEYASAPELEYYDPYATGEGSGGEMSYSGTVLKGRGQFFVSVRGIIPLHELIRDVAESRNCDFAQAAHYFQLIDYQLERQAAQDDGTWPAEDSWEPVDRQTALSILQEVDGFDLDPVPPQLTDVAVTMPLPARITGVWGRHATHPDLENFSLSPEDMENELKYQRALLKTVQEQEALKTSAAPSAGPVVKTKGWSDVAYDSRHMAQELTGADSSYGSQYEDYYASQSESSLYGQMTTSQQTDAKFQELVKKLTAQGSVDKKTEDKELKEYIQNRVTAVGNLILFRYVDFAVEPGKTYRYRARLEIENPNFQARVQDAAAPSVVEGETRLNAWSNITDPVSVERSTYYFVNRIDERKNTVDIDFFHRDPSLGTIVSNAEPDPPEDEHKGQYGHLSVGLGEPVGGNMEVWELSPGAMTFAKDEIDGTVKEEDGDTDAKGYTFDSGDLLVASLDNYDLDRREHPDLQIPRIQNFDLHLDKALLIQNSDGRLTQLDSTSQQPWLNYMLTTIEKQNEPFRDLKQGKAVEGEGCPCLEGLYSGGEYEAAMGEGESGSRRSNKRTRSVLRKSGSRADASRSGSSSRGP